MIEGWSDVFCSNFNNVDGCPVKFCRSNLSEKCSGGDNSPNPTLTPFKGEKWPDYKIRLDTIERYLSASTQEAQEIDESTSMHSLLPPGDVADLETLPPYEGRQTNIIFRNKYYFRDPRPDQYDFDPNSNVPQSRGSVRSIGRRNPIPRQSRQPRSRIQRRQDKILEKPAKKTVKVNPKGQKTPPSFAKTINQLLPILLILLIFLFIVYFYKKRG